MMLTDKQFYKAALDLHIPEMAEAGRLYFAGDEAGAARVFADYVRKHTDYARYFGLPGNAREFSAEERAKITAAADRVLDGWFAPTGYAYRFENLEMDWVTNRTPNNYGEWVWQLNRHPEFVTLAKAYLITEDDRYVDAFAKLIESWIDQEEFPIADVVNRHGSRQLAGWRTIESGIRMGPPWQYPIHVFLEAGKLSDALIVKIFKSVWEHAYHLRHYCSTHNWLIIELTGFLQIACFYPFFENAAAWRKFIFERLLKEIDVQIYPEGFQYELATGYHFGVLDLYLRCVDIARAYSIEVPAYMLERLRSMTHAIVRITQPDWHMPDLNDGSSGSMVARCAHALRFFPEDEVFRYFATEGREGHKPPYLSTVLPYVGHCAMRTGWGKEDIYAFFDSAYYGWGHAHEDKLSFNLSAYGKNLLTDGGQYEYDSSLMRDMIIRTRAHNTALVDMQDQRRGHHTDFHTIESRAVAEKIPSDLAWNFGEEYECAAGTYNCGYGVNPGVFAEHHRKVIFFKKGLGAAKPFFVLLDTFTPQDDAEHLYEVHFQLGTEPTDETEYSITAHHGDGVTLTLIGDAPLITHTAEKEPRYMGWRKLRLSGVEHEHYPAPAPCFTRKGRTEYFITAVYPAKDESCPITAVAADKDSFTVTMADGGSFTFAKADPAFAVMGTEERLAKGLDICL